MRRRTRPSARTTRTAPTAPWVPVSRDGARVPRSVPPMAGPVTGNGSCTSVEGGSERSTGSLDGPPAPAPAVVVGSSPSRPRALALLPGVAYWDTGELQAVAPLMGTAHPTGFPTYVLLGWLASVVLQPFGEPAFRMNLLSACAWRSRPA